MKILAMDSSASPASVAIVEDCKILARFFINTGLTHSQTLLPMVESVLSATELTVGDIDLVAVANGPGSFTGVRIGVATAKGLCFANGTSCVGVSTLEAMAQNFVSDDCVVFALMDARRMQVYNAVFQCQNGEICRLTEDRAVSIESLKEDIEKNINKKIVFVGDGAELCYETIGKEYDNVVLSSENVRYQDAVGVAFASKNKEVISADKLTPVYLRLPQAQRELKLKMEKREEV